MNQNVSREMMLVITEQTKEIKIQITDDLIKRNEE